MPTFVRSNLCSDPYFEVDKKPDGRFLQTVTAMLTPLFIVLFFGFLKLLKRKI